MDQDQVIGINVCCFCLLLIFHVILFLFYFFLFHFFCYIHNCNLFLIVAHVIHRMHTQSIVLSFTDFNGLWGAIVFLFSVCAVAFCLLTVIFLPFFVFLILFFYFSFSQEKLHC